MGMGGGDGGGAGDGDGKWMGEEKSGRGSGSARESMISETNRMQCHHAGEKRMGHVMEESSGKK
jgi:hypothetical protein